jgi:hypothetical protein
MNTNVSPVEMPFSAMAMSHQHDNTPIMQKLGGSMSELGPVGNQTTSSPCSEPTSPHNDPACGIMKNLPFVPIFFVLFSSSAFSWLAALEMLQIIGLL